MAGAAGKGGAHLLREGGSGEGRSRGHFRMGVGTRLGVNQEEAGRAGAVSCRTCGRPWHGGMSRVTDEVTGRERGLNGDWGLRPRGLPGPTAASAPTWQAACLHHPCLCGLGQQVLSMHSLTSPSPGQWYVHSACPRGIWLPPPSPKQNWERSSSGS